MYSAATPAGRREYVRVPFADVGPLKVPDSLVGRAGAVSLRHLPDRLHGGGELQHQAWRHGCGLGMRPCRPVRHQERFPARGRARDRHRHGSRAARAGRVGRRAPKSIDYDDKSMSTTHPVEMTGGPRTGCLHRRGRHRGHGHDARRRAYDRVKTSDVHGDRSAARAAAGDRLSAGRAARSRSPACTAVSLDKFPLGRGDQSGADASRWARPTCSAICARCSSASRTARSIPSFVITHRVPLDEAPDVLRARSATSRTSASRS